MNREPDPTPQPTGLSSSTKAKIGVTIFILGSLIAALTFAYVVTLIVERPTGGSGAEPAPIETAAPENP